MTRNIIVILVAAVFAFASCEENREMVTISDNITPSTLSATSASDYVFTEETEANTFETFAWSAVDFGFQASVTYTLQVAAGGSEFAEPIDLLSSQALTADISVKEFNQKMIDAGFEIGVVVGLDFRINASVSTSIEPVVSDLVSVNVTLYPTQAPPIYMIGAGVGGWDPAFAITMESTGPLVYTTTCNFIENETFRFFAQLDWGPTSWNYPAFAGGNVDPLFEDALDGDNNFRFLGTTGDYTITTDLGNLTVVITTK